MANTVLPQLMSQASPKTKPSATTGTSAPKQKKTTKTAAGGRAKKESGSTRKRKSDVDPLAPKKPSNAFFWFCQEYRPGLQEHFKGEGMAGQHDLTKILAKLWSETKMEDRKVYTLARYLIDWFLSLPNDASARITFPGPTQLLIACQVGNKPLCRIKRS